MVKVVKLEQSYLWNMLLTMLGLLTNVRVFNYRTVAEIEDPLKCIHQTTASIWLELLMTRKSETSSLEKSRRSWVAPGTGTINPSDKTILFQQLLGGCNYRFTNFYATHYFVSHCSDVMRVLNRMQWWTAPQCLLHPRLRCRAKVAQMHGGPTSVWNNRCLGAIDVPLHSKAHSTESCNAKPNCSVSTILK